MSTASAAAAAAAIRRRMQQEEEEMTPYRDADLAGEWEFKILRSTTGAFKHPDRLRQVLAEEARAGWVLLEKFDDGRIRLKRPADAKSRDAGLDFDPYRTHIGLSEGKFALVIVGCTLGGMALLATLIALIALAFG